jgi:hypothetical protein
LAISFSSREGKILRLFAETGEIEPLAESLEDFLSNVENDIETFLTVGFRDKAAARRTPFWRIRHLLSRVGCERVPQGSFRPVR